MAVNAWVVPGKLTVNTLVVNGSSVIPPVQPDWNETDNTQLDYIKNKPFSTALCWRYTQNADAPPNTGTSDVASFLSVPQSYWTQNTGAGFATSNIFVADTNRYAPCVTGVIQIPFSGTYSLYWSAKFNLIGTNIRVGMQTVVQSPNPNTYGSGPAVRPTIGDYTINGVTVCTISFTGYWNAGDTLALTASAPVSGAYLQKSDGCLTLTCIQRTA